MNALMIIRHGQSQWNLENRFTGWTDVPLTERGRADAQQTAEVLRDVRFDAGFTSRLQRASETMRIILEMLGQENIPVTVDSALNERHYGDLQGLNKAETAAKYGQEKVLQWRRGYAVRPPGGESIADTALRVLPFLRGYILPHVHAGKNVIVTASGNSMRPILQLFDRLDDETTATMEVGLCTPYIYWFEGEKLVKKEVRNVPGIVTKGASQTESTVKEGRV
ncbi:2,3-bisphosphoglycerate-dependent phosphoglycerate mutase [Candidatus Peregrinibacteria bacterium]|nr:2,3-bisphosphoglycerate-dependent phosphoglycerate mutase [Candidatus Peregrinibacteria bacterium]MBI3816873.1 2,3-bisphosphoglycerate-dependent phosphoglycerate mutase [Candidatus Peregrinibacteria bacterium]